MTTLRRLTYAALAVAYTHLVFGAIVRISGSGLGCGENWPLCYGHLFPPLDQPTLVIEWTHRLLASILTTTVTILAVVAWRKRNEPGVAGPGGVMRSAFGALAGVFTAAALGAVTVFLGNAPYATAAHWTVAMTVIALLAVSAVRASGVEGPGSRVERAPSARSTLDPRPSALLPAIAAALAFATVVFGGLTAKVPFGSVACRQFPLCGVNPDAPMQAVVIQSTHRILAFTVFAYLLVMAFALRKRGHRPAVVRAGRIAFGIATLQIVVAGAMIGMHMPAVVRSLHEAVGVAVWIATFTFAYLAGRGTRDAGRVLASEELEPVLAHDAIRATPAGASSYAVAEPDLEEETVPEAWQADVQEPPAPAQPAEAQDMAKAEEAERVPPPASRVPTMAVIVARGADIL